VIVGQQDHARSPDDVQDGEIVGAVELRELGPSRLSERAEDGGGVGHCSRGDLANRSMGFVGFQGGAAIRDELLQEPDGSAASGMTAPPAV